MTADPFGWAGQVIDGRYRAIEVAGDGGFGVVYRGHHLALDVPIAIKCLKVPQSLGPEERESFEQRFLEEGRVLHRLSRASAGVVQALDVGAATSPDGTWTPYLVLEWLDGHTLEDELVERARRGRARWNVAEAVELLGPAARALAEAHEQRIAHRDIKPANLFLTRVGERDVLKVLDFGIAKVLHDSMSTTTALRATGATGPGSSVFTPQYGAPEQFDRRKGATGPWTDVHAFALVFVEMLVGARALEGDDIVQLMSAALDRDMRPTPRAHGLDLGDELEGVLQQALALRPEDRFADAGVFWDAVLDAGDALDLDDEDAAAAAAADATEAATPDAPPHTAPSPSQDDDSTDTGVFLAQLEAASHSSPGRVSPRASAATPTSHPATPRASKTPRRRASAGDRASGRGPGKARPGGNRRAQLAPTIEAASGGASKTPQRVARSGQSTTDAAVVSGAASERSKRQRRSAQAWRMAALALLAVVGVVMVSRFTRQEPPRAAPEAPPATAPAGSGHGAEPPATAVVATAANPANSTEPAAPGGSGGPPSSSSTNAEPPSTAAPIAPPSPNGTTTAPSPPASATAPAAATSAELLAPPDYCTASCRVEGQCRATLIGKVVVCRAESNADCKGSYGCTVHGACWARDGYCVALTPDDCAKSLGCKQTRECDLRNGKCLSELITDCTKYPICKSVGACTARDNACYATTNAMCAASQICADQGFCRSDGKQCVQ